MLYNTRIKQLNRAKYMPSTQFLELLELHAHLVSAKAETLAWIAEDPDNRWACYATTDLDHWTEQGIRTIAQYEHHMAAADHYDTYKDVNGIRCRWMDYDSMTTKEIELETAALNEQWQGEAEYQAEEDAFRASTADENHRYNDMFRTDPEVTKYELMAEAAGF